jgi:hypothetical protein
MKPILLLSDEPETVRLMLEQVTSGRVAVRESEARAIAIAGAIHAQGVSIRKKTKRKPTLRFPHQSNSEVNKWNI